MVTIEKSAATNQRLLRILLGALLIVLAIGAVGAMFAVLAFGTALVFDDTGEPASRIAAYFAPSQGAIVFFLISIALTMRAQFRLTMGRVSTAVISAALLLLYLTLVPHSRLGFDFVKDMASQIDY